MAIVPAVAAVKIGAATAVADIVLDEVGSKHFPRDHVTGTVIIAVASISWVAYRRLPLAPYLASYYGLYICANLKMALRGHNHPELGGRTPPVASVEFNLFKGS